MRVASKSTVPKFLTLRCLFSSFSTYVLEEPIHRVDACTLTANFQMKKLIKDGDILGARQLFDELHHRDEVSWANMLSGYVNANDATQALLLFAKMKRNCSLIDPFSVSFALKACGVNPNAAYGGCVHGISVKISLISSVFVGSALVDMYMKIGWVRTGCSIFHSMVRKNVVTWTAVITGLVNSAFHDAALVFFAEMVRQRKHCDCFVISIALKACTRVRNFHYGREIHCHAMKKGVHDSPFAASGIAAMYRGCEKLECAVKVLEMATSRDVATWTSLVNAYKEGNQPLGAVGEFVRMLESGFRPNEFTFASIFSCCAKLRRSEWAAQLHAHSIRLGLVDEIAVANSVIHAYTLCGKTNLAAQMFDEMDERDAVSWSAVISDSSQEFFARMRVEGEKMNEFPLSMMLKAYGNIAAIEEGKQLHALGILSGLHHFDLVRSSLISMYSKCGDIVEARKAFEEGNQSDVVSWTAIIKGYGEHGLFNDAIHLFEKMVVAGYPLDSVTFIAILSACSHSGKVNIGCDVFKSMARHGISPSQEHYGCVLDLLCRAGRLEEAEELIETTPLEAGEVYWPVLLRACRIHGDSERENRCWQKLMKLGLRFGGKWKEWGKVRCWGNREVGLSWIMKR